MSEFLNNAIVKVQNAKYAFCRFITANDVGKNGSHQAGFYIPKCAAALLFDTPGVKGENKDKIVKVKWQDDFTTDSRFIYLCVVINVLKSVKSDGAAFLME